MFDTIVLSIPNSENISFKGKIVAQVKIKNLVVYETEKGHWFVAIVQSNTCFKHNIVNNKDEDELKSLLGMDSDAKNIYSQLGINIVKKLDI